MDAGSSSTTTANRPEKRIQPSRSRRGGPGVGNCEMDILILDTQRRKFENEPLIPADTPFLLTTNSKFASTSPEDSEPGIKINVVANDRYFDRPEVLKGFREQSIIQTPEFDSIGETTSLVGGRFRPRGQEDELAETSDAAYEKRHRKYETFEKRQRLREKEKLKHEHYKLKERIDQLRAMDGSAFMGLPASAFSPPPPIQVANDLDEAPADDGLYSLVNGAIPNVEGERRKQEMLDIAMKLEERYAYLLPPDRVRKLREPSTSGPAPKTDSETRDDEELENETIFVTTTSKKELGNTSIRLRIPSMKSSASNTPAPSPAPPKPAPARRGRPPKQLAATLNSISTAGPLPPTEQQPLRSTPFIDIEMSSPDSTRISSPLPSVRPSTRATDVEPSAAPITRNGASHAGDVEMGPPADEVPSVNGKRAKKGKGKPPLPTRRLPPSARLVKAPVDNEGESEIEEDELEVAGTRSSPELAQGNKVAPETDDEEAPEDQGVSPEMREISTRLEQTNFAGPSTEGSVPITGNEPTEDDAHEPPEVPPVEELESISVRPTKRRRKYTRVAEDPIDRTPSMQPGEGSAITTTTKARTKRDQPFIDYRSSRTGDKVRTYSSLMLAAFKSNTGGKSRAGKRGNNSFGVVTPKFEALGDWEMPEEILYPDEHGDGPNVYFGNHEPPPPVNGMIEQESTRAPADQGQQAGVDPAGKANDAIETEPGEVEKESSLTRAATEETEDDATKSAEQDEHPEPTTESQAEEADESKDSDEIPLVHSPELTTDELEPGLRPRELSHRNDGPEEEVLEW